MTEYEPNGKVKVEWHEVDYDYTVLIGDLWAAHCTCGKTVYSVFAGRAEQAVRQHADDMNRNRAGTDTQ